MDIVQHDLITFPAMNMFVPEIGPYLKRMLDVLGFENIREVCGFPVEYYCSADKHAIDTLLQFHGDFLTLNDHPPGSMIKFVKWENVIWDPDHHEPCTFLWVHARCHL